MAIGGGAGQEPISLLSRVPLRAYGYGAEDTTLWWSVHARSEKVLELVLGAECF